MSESPAGNAADIRALKADVRSLQEDRDWWIYGLSEAVKVDAAKRYELKVRFCELMLLLRNVENVGIEKGKRGWNILYQIVGPVVGFALGLIANRLHNG